MDLNAHYSKETYTFKRDITNPQKKPQKKEHFVIEPMVSWFAFVKFHPEIIIIK